jgi:hypothetical protein
MGAAGKMPGSQPSTLNLQPPSAGIYTFVDTAASVEDVNWRRFRYETRQANSPVRATYVNRTCERMHASHTTQISP